MLPPEKLTPIFDLIQRLDLKEHKTEQEIIKLRNLRRFITLFYNHAYCPLQKRELFEDEVLSCMMCDYGHITECHYPHQCNSEYCHHYRAEQLSESIKIQKINFILKRIKGTILEQIGLMQGIRDNLEFSTTSH